MFKSAPLRPPPTRRALFLVAKRSYTTFSKVYKRISNSCSVKPVIAFIMRSFLNAWLIVLSFTFHVHLSPVYPLSTCLVFSYVRPGLFSVSGFWSCTFTISSPCSFFPESTKKVRLLTWKILLASTFERLSSIKARTRFLNRGNSSYKKL